ncbi:hypothetical protein DNHGIG_18270 [Collibacillus ludicampi]|uniref:Uncharacterized protein n=1 Tax=Collibacillus ludicampi TaxID=2771369 RepID=A0AAV4LF11_9BACL|nr:hypothetical protein [Collibacillus ludicampi]GIM46278.1 hypothetical protein DNHGIG_18270 [Collibacillus ludicampi]
MKKNIWAFLAIGLALLFFLKGDISHIFSSEYEVVSVSNGAVQVVNVKTGVPTQIFDDQLVRQALNGEIKKGDLIRW